MERLEMTTRIMAKKKAYRQKLFTTGEIAGLVDTTPKTVARWIDEGLLPGVKLPGMVERRVHRDDARKFFVEMGYHWAVKDLDNWEDRDAPEPPAPDAPEPGKPKRK